MSGDFEKPAGFQETIGRPKPRASLARGWTSPVWDTTHNQDDGGGSDDDRESMDGASTALGSRTSHHIPTLFAPHIGTFARQSTMGAAAFGAAATGPTTFDAELLQRGGGGAENAAVSRFSAASNRDSSYEGGNAGTSKGSAFFRRLQRRWSHFSLFGLSTDPSPQIWGTQIRTCSRTCSSSDAIQRIVRNHECQGEMALMLRDQRVKFSYFDLFESDYGMQKKHMIRCFSWGAYYLEMAKIGLGAEALVIAVAVFCFWEVKSTEVFPSYVLCLLDLIFDLFYLMCFTFELRTTILDHERGAEMCDSKTILRSRVLTPFFWCELMSLLLPTFAIRSMRTSGVPSEVARSLVVVRMARGRRVFDKPTRHRFIPSQSFIFGRLFFAILLFGHVLACFWYCLFFELLGTHNKSDLPQVPGNLQYDDPGPFNYYGYAFNEGIYLLMGIDRQGKSTGEHFFLAMVLPCAAIFHAYIFGEIFLVIQRMSALETKAQEHSLAINEAMKVLGLSPALQLRIISYFTYERLHRNAHAFQELYRLLSPQLRFELHLYLYTDLIANTNLFRKSKPRIIRDMVTLLNDIIFLPGDYVVRFGEHGDSMYFIIKGQCAVLASDNETILSVLERGSYFGEIALLTGVRRTAYVRSDVFCVLAQLTKSAFEPIIREYPEEIDILVGEIINVAEREKVRDEAFRYYGMKCAPGTRASMASCQQWPGADKRCSVGPSPTDAPYTDGGRLRLPSAVFRRGSNVSGRISKIPRAGSIDAPTEAATSSDQPVPTINTLPPANFQRNTVTNARVSHVGKPAEPKPEKNGVVSDSEIEDLLSSIPAPDKADDDPDANVATESRASLQSWVMPGKSSLLSRLTQSKGKRMSSSKPAGGRSSVLSIQDTASIGPHMVAEVKALREQLAELMAGVADIPTSLQQHQIHLARAMNVAKDEVVEELWGRFGSMPVDIQELTLAFNDVMRMEMGNEP